MCGGTELVKQDGVFVCQDCGAKYSTDEAKKLLVDNTSCMGESALKVKIDHSKELDNLYEIARRAKNDNNTENAQKYYEQIIVKDPSSWEANFYTVYYQSMNCKIAGIQNAAVRLLNCEDTVLKLIKENVSDLSERQEAINEVAIRLINISNMLFNAARNHYKGIDYSIKYNYTQEYVNNCCAARDIVYKFGNWLVELFDDLYEKSYAVPCWKTGISIHEVLLPDFADKSSNKKIIADYVSKIRKYEKDYKKEDDIKAIQVKLTENQEAIEEAQKKPKSAKYGAIGCIVIGLILFLIPGIVLACLGYLFIMAIAYIIIGVVFVLAGILVLKRLKKTRQECEETIQMLTQINERLNKELEELQK